MTGRSLLAIQVVVGGLNALALGGAVALGVAEGWDAFALGAALLALVGLVGVSYDVLRDDARDLAAVVAGRRREDDDDAAQ